MPFAPLDDLRHGDPSARREAVVQLAAHALEEPVWASIAAMLADEDRGVRDAAAGALAAHAAAAAAVAVHLLSEDAAVRNLAGQTLVGMGAAAADALVPYVHHPDADVRKFAIDLLPLMPAPETIAEIAKHLTDADPNVVCAAIDAVGVFSADAYAERLVGLYAEAEFARPSILNACRSFGSSVPLTFLEAALADDDPVAQSLAAEALSERSEPEAEALLYEHLAAADEMVRPMLVHALVARAVPGRSTDARLIPYLGELLGDPDDAVAIAAVRALSATKDKARFARVAAHIGRTPALDAAIFAAMSADPAAGLQAILGCARRQEHPSSDCLTFLIALLLERAGSDIAADEAEDESIRCIAEAFGGLSYEEGAAALELFRARPAEAAALAGAALRHSDAELRLLALSMIGEDDPGRFISEIAPLQSDDDPTVAGLASDLCHLLTTEVPFAT